MWGLRLFLSVSCHFPFIHYTLSFPPGSPPGSFQRVLPACHRLDRNNSQAVQVKQRLCHTIWKPLCFLWAAHCSKNASLIHWEMAKSVYTHCQTNQNAHENEHTDVTLTWGQSRLTQASSRSGHFSDSLEYTTSIVWRLWGPQRERQRVWLRRGGGVYISTHQWNYSHSPNSSHLVSFPSGVQNTLTLAHTHVTPGDAWSFHAV